MTLSTTQNTIRFAGDQIYINGDMYMNPQGFESLDQIQEDPAPKYLVAEYVSNFSLLYIVSAFDEQEAVDNCIDVEYEDVVSVEAFSFGF